MPAFEWEKVSRDDATYKACVVASTTAGFVVGQATGAPLLLPGVLAGAAAGTFWGFVAGYALCPYLAPNIKRRIELGELLSASEVEMAAEAMGRYAQVATPQQALKLLAMVKGWAAPQGTPSCADPRLVARGLLATA